jgi:hypothetical protein
MTKLTLSIEEGVVEKAKRIAEANKTSVSAMFSQFVRSMDGRRARSPRIGPLTRKLSGIVKLPRNKNYKQLLAEALVERYGTAE